jgi:hypothetical protein
VLFFVQKALCVDERIGHPDKQEIQQVIGRNQETYATCPLVHYRNLPKFKVALLCQIRAALTHCSF